MWSPTPSHGVPSGFQGGQQAGVIGDAPGRRRAFSDGGNHFYPYPAPVFLQHPRPPASRTPLGSPPSLSSRLNDQQAAGIMLEMAAQAGPGVMGSARPYPGPFVAGSNAGSAGQRRRTQSEQQPHPARVRTDTPFPLDADWQTFRPFRPDSRASHLAEDMDIGVFPQSDGHAGEVWAAPRLHVAGPEAGEPLARRAVLGVQIPNDGLYRNFQGGTAVGGLAHQAEGLFGIRGAYAMNQGAPLEIPTGQTRSLGDAPHPAPLHTPGPVGTPEPARLRQEHHLPHALPYGFQGRGDGFLFPSQTLGLPQSRMNPLEAAAVGHGGVASYPQNVQSSSAPWRGWESSGGIPAGGNAGVGGPVWDVAAPLRQSVPFRPLQDQGTRADKPKRPSPYDGKTSCRDYLVQFDLISSLNRWDDRTKAMELATSLKGSAVSVLTDLDPSQRGDYGSLVKALLSRFEPDNQSEVFRAQLKGKRRRGTEPLTELAQEVKTLARKAYPQAHLELREAIAKDCFVDALNDAELEWSVYREKTRTLNEALTVALEHEAFKAGRQKRTTSSFQPLRSQVSEEPWPDAEKILGRLAAILDKPAEPSKTKEQTKKRTNSTKGACFYCEETDHYVANCPKKKRDQAKKKSGRQAPARDRPSETEQTMAATEPVTSESSGNEL